MVNYIIFLNQLAKNAIILELHCEQMTYVIMLYLITAETTILSMLCYRCIILQQFSAGWAATEHVVCCAVLHVFSVVWGV